MNLVIFDVDGTLAHTNEIHEACLRKTFLEEFEPSCLDYDWTKCRHITDSFVYSDTFRRNKNRAASDEEIQNYQKRFLTALELAHQEDPLHFREVAGSPLVLDVIRQTPSWHVAIATGGWKATATFKLNCIGVNWNQFPSAFADDGFSREEIVLTSIRRAQEFNQIEKFSRLVYVGDGLWDAKTCKNLGIPFIGISTHHSEETLLKVGAFKVFSDFKESQAFLACLGGSHFCRPGTRLPHSFL